MRTRWIIASSLVVALFGCGGADERVAEEERGDYATPRTLAPELPPAAEPTESGSDVAAAPPAAVGGDQDLEITRKIREKLVAGDQPLSSHAQNIEVSAQQGVVTLRGRVENEREKEIVLSIARSTEEVTGVENDLEIAEP